MATSTEISFGLFDVTAKSDSTPSCPDKQPFVDIEQLKLDAVTAPPAATLEPNSWLLDGRFEAFPDAPETKTFGLWSETMSNRFGQFTKLMPPAPPTFTRSSVAYLSDGTQVPANTPRFEQGKFGKAVLIEEGTTNLLSANVSSVETDLSGIGFWRATMQRVTTESWHGEASIEMTLTHPQGTITCRHNIIPVVGTKYTGSAWVKGTPGKQMCLVTRMYGGASNFSDMFSPTITLDGTWQRLISTHAVDYEDRTQVQLHVFGYGEAGDKFYVDGLQIEQKAYATSWTLGGTTRSHEALTIPVSVINPQEGTIEFWVYVTNSLKDPSRYYPNLFAVFGQGGSSYGWFAVDHGQNTNSWRLATAGPTSTSTDTLFISDSLTPVGWNCFAVTWAKTDVNRADCKLYVNGNLAGSKNMPFPTSFNPSLYIGWIEGLDARRVANTLYDDLRISSRARTDEEILAAYQSGQHLPVDEWTTYKMGFDDTLEPDDVFLAAPPILTIEFNGNHSSLGVSFEFDPYGNNYPYHINIKWYGTGGTVLLADEDFYPDSWRYSAMKTVENYDKLVITFYSMSVPYRYLKLQKINYGVLREFGPDEVIEAGILEEINPISAELSINMLNFRLHSPDAEFNILNPQGIYTLLQQRQPLVVTERINGASKPMGTFFLDEWENDTENTFKMSAMDAIGIMDGTTYLGGMYNGVMAATLMADILEDAGFGYDIDASYVSVPVSGWLPILSHREALQQVAFAVGAVVDTSRSDIVRVYPLPETVAGTITKDRKHTGGSVKLRGLVTGAEVIAHNYVESAEEMELFNGNLAAGEHEITFNEPAHDLSISGATITASNCNYARVNVASPGTVVLSGKRYVDTTQVYGVYMDTLPAGAKENILKVEEATLVSSTNAQTVAQQVYDYYQRRIEQTVSMLLDTEQVGQTVEVETLYNQLRAGAIESLDTTLTGGFRTKAVIVGE